jgi:hypothetical protein
MALLAFLASNSAGWLSPVRPACNHRHLALNAHRTSALFLSYAAATSGYARGEDGGKIDVDEELVDSLIRERGAFRDQQNFAEADAIQDRLSDMGVTLRDKEKTWVADGKKRKPKRIRGPRKAPEGQDAPSSAPAIKELAALVEDAATALEEVAAMEEEAAKMDEQLGALQAGAGTSQVEPPSATPGAAPAPAPALAPAPAPALAPAPAPASAPASGQATEKPGTVRERLIALKELLELGLIFPEEFEQKRADILQELTDGPL